MSLLCSCGGQGEPEDATAPGPVVEATPAPPPVPPAPARLWRVQLSERIDAPALPLRSPLARTLPVLPVSGPDAGFLRADGAPEAAAATLESLASGVGPAGGEVALIEWELVWGDDSGRARYWGLCSLPCTVTDSFVATDAHYPLDPVAEPMALFAERPGATSLSLSVTDGELLVAHGGSPLCGAGGGPVESAAEINRLTMTADLAQIEPGTVASRRSLACRSVSSSSFPITEESEAASASISVLPSLPTH